MFLRFLLSLFLTTSCLQSALACDNKLLCIEEDNWSVGIAFGAGARTNPLVDGDAIPLIVLPDVAWYSDNAYFDNGEFGYQLQLDNEVTAETFVRTNAERAYFVFWHPSNLLIPLESLTDGALPPSPSPGEGEVPEPRYISVNDIANRRWTVDAGVRLNWFRDTSRWSFSVVHDALGVYSGYSINGGYQRDFFYKDWTFSTNLSVSYKSDNLIDYYYGISERDTSDQSLWYEASHSIQFTAGLFVSKQINQHWYWLGRYQLTTLGSGMSDSPLVSKRQVTNVFFGIGYRF